MWMRDVFQRPFVSMEASLMASREREREREREHKEGKHKEFIERQSLSGHRVANLMESLSSVAECTQYTHTHTVQVDE